MRKYKKLTLIGFKNYKLNFIREILQKHQTLHGKYHKSNMAHPFSDCRIDATTMQTGYNTDSGQGRRKGLVGECGAQIHFAVWRPSNQPNLVSFERSVCVGHVKELFCKDQ